jgi:hypothetical protein
MILGIFKPTVRRSVVFLFFLALPLTGLLDQVLGLKFLLWLPYMLVADRLLSVLAQAIYSYLVACIYAAAYVWIEAKIRKQYPDVNAPAERWKKKHMRRKKK